MMPNGSLNCSDRKKIEFQKSKMADGPIVKNVKSPYLWFCATVRLILMKFLHNEAYWSPAPDVKFNFFYSRQSYSLYGGEPLSWEMRIEKLLKYIVSLHNNTLHNFDNKTANINTKNCSLSILLTATNQKPQKSFKRWYYSASSWHSVDVMILGNVTFLMIFAVFDLSPLTRWINCSF